MSRPENCRNRLRDEGKAYPKSGCAACKTGGLTGCPWEKVGCIDTPMTPEPSPLNDLRSALVAIIQAENVADEHGNVWGAGDAADKLLAGPLAPLLARITTAERERDEATKRAETAEAEVAAVIEWAGERKGWPDLKTKMDLLVRGANQAEADALAAETRADRLGVDLAAARAEVERQGREITALRATIESAPGQIEPPGCPLPGACACPGVAQDPAALPSREGDGNP